jgi:hypothetical protein
LDSFLSKLAPLTNSRLDSDAKFNDKSKSVHVFVWGASFYKKKSNRNLAGSVLKLQPMVVGLFMQLVPHIVVFGVQRLIGGMPSITLSLQPWQGMN